MMSSSEETNRDAYPMDLSMMVFLQEPDGPASAINCVRRPNADLTVRQRPEVGDGHMKALRTHHGFHR